MVIVGERGVTEEEKDREEAGDRPEDVSEGKEISRCTSPFGTKNDEKCVQRWHRKGD